MTRGFTFVIGLIVGVGVGIAGVFCYQVYGKPVLPVPTKSVPKPFKKRRIGVMISNSKSSSNRIILIIAVVALYLMCQIVADVSAVKLVELWGLTFAGGTFIYAISFTARDLAHKQLGKRATIALIVVAGIVNVLMALYFVLIIKLPYPVWWGGQDALAMTLGVVPRIVGASIAAELVAQLIDTELYQLVWKKWPKAPQFLRVIASNGVAAPLDSIIFVAIAFYGTMPMVALWSIVWGQTVWKWVLTLISMPSIYLIPQNPDVAP